MRRVAASLAAVLAALALAACGDDGAEPGAPVGATLVLDFRPNAVHAGLYAAKARGYFENEGIDLDIREPSGTADGAKLLAAGRADFAILDINDFGIARERGLDLVAIAAIVQRPLASVIAADRGEIRTPADLEGKTIGVTGVPSDDAVLDTILAEGGVPPDTVDRKTIGFESVPLLAAARVDAATAFWNAEGVDLARMGVPTRELRVDEFGAPRYPELVIAAQPDETELSCELVEGLDSGYDDLGSDPEAALRALLDANPDLDAGSQRAQLQALTGADAFGAGDATPQLSGDSVIPWVDWAQHRGILNQDARTGEAVDDGFRLNPDC